MNRWLGDLQGPRPQRVQYWQESSGEKALSIIDDHGTPYCLWLIPVYSWRLYSGSLKTFQGCPAWYFAASILAIPMLLLPSYVDGSSENKCANIRNLDSATGD